MKARDPIRSRPFAGHADYDRVRELLIETYSITPHGWNWEIRRWEGMWTYTDAFTWETPWANRIRLWETDEGRLVGAVCPEGDWREAHLQLHPAYRYLEEEMLTWAEGHIAQPPEPGARPELLVYAFEYDARLISLLRRRGYEQQQGFGVSRWMRLDGALPAREPLAPGYALHAMQPDDPANGERLAALLNAAFGRDGHNGAEYANMTRMATCYVPETDLVAVAPDGTYASYAAVNYDRANRYAFYEPVCTHPDHRRRGLARALMIEGLHRIAALGALDLSVATGDMVPANGLYDSIGFTETLKGHAWNKTI